MSPLETRRNNLKWTDEKRKKKSVYSDMVGKWLQDIEPFIAQYKLQCDPIDHLSIRVQHLREQHKEIEKRQLGIQKESGEIMDIPVEGPEPELEEGEIRRTPPVEVNPSEVGVSNFLICSVTSNQLQGFLKLLERVQQFRTSRKVKPKIGPDPEDVPANINSVEASEAVMHIIEDETTSVLNAGIVTLLLTIVNLEDICVSKTWDILKDTLKVLEAINVHLEHAEALPTS